MRDAVQSESNEGKRTVVVHLLGLCRGCESEFLAAMVHAQYVVRCGAVLGCFLLGVVVICVEVVLTETRGWFALYVCRRLERGGVRGRVDFSRVIGNVVLQRTAGFWRTRRDWGG